MRRHALLQFMLATPEESKPEEGIPIKMSGSLHPLLDLAITGQISAMMP
jgi:hypothetical protein